MGRDERLASQVIAASDVLLLVLDARCVPADPYPALVRKIRKCGKRYVFVVNKVDLIGAREQSRIRIAPAVFVSATSRVGTVRLLRKIMELGRGAQVVAGVLGAPNVGKSSLINALKGRRSASTSPVAGHTRGLQRVRVSGSVLLLDSPGVVDARAGLAALDPDREDPELLAFAIIEGHANLIEERFGVRYAGDAEETLARIAHARGVIGRGDVPDTRRMAVEIVRMWQRGTWNKR